MTPCARLEAMAAAAGATGPQIVNWGTVPPDEPTADGTRRGRPGRRSRPSSPSDDAWLALAPTLMNPIRENRSAALQAYLIAQRDGSGDLIYADADGLFDYFLIDVQMSSCQVTSRVVQAYIAVQIFVERCLMNLEAPEVIVDLHPGRHLGPVGVDKQIPRLGGEPRSLPLSRELADRIPAPQPHRDLPEARAGGAPGPEHRGLAWRPSSSITSTGSTA